MYDQILGAIFFGIFCISYNRVNIYFQFLGNCQYDEYKCNNGDCIQLSNICDGITDCKSGEDEANCPTTTPTPLIPDVPGNFID